jgi:hypothetical protein
MMMPRYINDLSLDENDIAGLVSYISSIFSEKCGGVSREYVMMI